jgi:hypothetical protein
MAEGYDCIGFDIEQHVYGDMRYPGQLVIQDALTLHGSQFKDAACIVCSPPCQKYSYMAMPWSRSKAMAADIRSDTTGVKLEELNRLFNNCFRIQREAIEAAGRYIPMVIENVRGAQPWVGRSRWNYGSFHLFGDVPALMPPVHKARKLAGFRFDGSGRSFQSASVEHTGVKAPGMNWSDRTKGERLSFTDIAGRHTAAAMAEGIKQRDLDGYEHNHPEAFDWKAPRTSSHSPQRKAASAMIAKIPFMLSSWIARCYYPRES